MAGPDPNLMALLMQYLSSGGAQAGMPPGPSSPIAQQVPPQQVAGQGILGQGMANQAQQIDQASGGQPPPPAQPQAPPSSPSTPGGLSPMQASPNIRPWAFTHLDPADW